MDAQIGSIVILKLTDGQCEEIQAGRDIWKSISERIAAGDGSLTNSNRISHIGNRAEYGQEYPMIVTAIWGPGTVNGQVWLDGNDTLWVTSAKEGTEKGEWHWQGTTSTEVPALPETSAKPWRKRREWKSADQTNVVAQPEVPAPVPQEDPVLVHEGVFEEKTYEDATDEETATS